MIAIPTWAGLGNQLFMIAAGFGFKISNPSAKLVFEDREHKDGRPTYWNTFFADCSLIQEARVSRLPECKWERHGNGDLAFIFTNYQGILRRNLRNNISTIISGYFQNLRYIPERETMIKIFNMLGKQYSMRERFNEIDFNTTCSIHFRMGDYKNHQSKFPLLTDEYYREALQEIRKNNPGIATLLIFNEKDDLKSVERRIPSIVSSVQYNIRYAVQYSLHDWEELVLMSLCKANIIANSTFSWWAAYLNIHVNAMVVCPRKWINTPDIEHWNLNLLEWKLL